METLTKRLLSGRSQVLALPESPIISIGCLENVSQRIILAFARVTLGVTPRPPHSADDHVAVALRSASGAIVPVPCGEETLDMIQHEAVVIRLGEGGSLLADVSSLFGSCRDCSGQNNLSVGQMGSHPTR
jgi:hypothetical protein